LGRVNDCLLQMNQRQQEVVLSGLVAEESHGHVAARLGIADAHVRVLLHRARAHLRSCAESGHDGSVERDPSPPGTPAEQNDRRV